MFAVRKDNSTYVYESYYDANCMYDKLKKSNGRVQMYELCKDSFKLLRDEFGDTRVLRG